MSALLDSNPEYKAITIMRLDWDSQGGEAIVKELGIGNRATLVMFKNGKELGRVLFKTSRADIEPLFKLAL